MSRIVMAAIALLAVSIPADATWKSEYSDASPETQEWYRTRELTPAAQLRFLFKSCCLDSDVVKTRFTVNKSDGGDEWFYEDVPGHWRRIPADVIHWGEHAPGGKPVLFVHVGQETCFFPGDGGI